MGVVVQLSGSVSGLLVVIRHAVVVLWVVRVVLLLWCPFPQTGYSGWGVVLARCAARARLVGERLLVLWVAVVSAPVGLAGG